MPNNLTPSTTDILTYSSTVPVTVAASYLGMCPQSVREGMKTGALNIGTRVKNRCYIYPAKLIAQKEGIESADRLTLELKTVAKMMESGVVTFDEIIALAAKRRSND